MAYYHGLETQKYWHQAITKELKEHRQQRNREAIGAFKIFLFSVLFIIGAGYAIQTMPTWLPASIEFLEYYGVLPSRHLFP